MTVTQAQLQSVMKLTFGGVTHRIERYTCTSALERTGPGHDVFRRFTYTIDCELEGADLANLRTQIDAARTSLMTSGADFKIYRAGSVIHQHDAADCHFGPTIRFDVNGNQQSGFFETITISVECLVPVAITAGVIDHTWREATSVDDEAETTSTVRTGSIVTEDGESAKGAIEDSLPAQPGGYDRQVDISTDDTDTSATYTLTDRLSDRRNTSATVRDHKYTKTTTTKSGVLETIVHNGTVRMVEGESARAFVEANLPAVTSGYARDYSVSNSDDDRDGSYSVTDTRASWSTIPGIEQAQLEESRSVDAQLRVVLERRGFFIGENAVQEIAAVRAALAALGTITFEEIRQDRYKDQRYSFRFTALSSDDADPNADPPVLQSGIVFWQEIVRRSGGARSRLISIYPDRDPFIYFGAPQPVVITLTGRLVSVSGAYYAAPAAPDSIADYQSGQTDEVRNRISERELETTWSMTFICPPGTTAPLPRSRTEVLA